MNALREPKNPTIRPTKNTIRVSLADAPKQLFRVVVNNYREPENELPEAPEETIGETINEEPQGLPPQPTGYLRFPTYDWF